MMTVRFPNGFSIQYNTANYAVRSQYGYTDLYDKKDGVWIAQVPTSGCVIEVVVACRTYNPTMQNQDARMSCIEKELSRMNRKITKALKK